MLTVREDCSPYYIRFHFDAINDIINICNESIQNDSFNNDKWLKMHRRRSDSIISLLPFKSEIELNRDRFTMFRTYPKWRSDIHKDSFDHRVSFNITISILDDKCITRWWSDDDMKDFKIDLLDNQYMKSRVLPNIDTSNLNPVKFMTAAQGEFILFNTDIYHDWDNSQSDNERIVLTMRHASPGNFYFDDAKRILFKYI